MEQQVCKDQLDLQDRQEQMETTEQQGRKDSQVRQVQMELTEQLGHKDP
jgi:hypothetical protein